MSLSISGVLLSLMSLNNLALFENFGFKPFIAYLCK